MFRPGKYNLMVGRYMTTKYAVSLAFLACVSAASCAPASGQDATARNIDWQTSPLDLDLRGMNGETYTFYCPPGKPEPSRVDGSGPYTDSSSICTAAVHAGVIRPQNGGSVAIEIRPGQNGGYAGSERNYIRTGNYDRLWSGSFVVISTQTAGSSR